MPNIKAPRFATVLNLNQCFSRSNFEAKISSHLILVLETSPLRSLYALIFFSTYVLLKVLEYKIEGSDKSALLTQMARMAAMMTQRDGFGFNGKMMARYL